MTQELSIAERIVEVILCRLRGIRIADGFRTDAGLRVFDSVRSVDQNQLPCIVVFDGAENATNSAGGRSYDNTLQIIVEGRAEANKDATGKILRMLKADIKTAVLVDGDEIGAVSYFGTEPTSRQDGDISESALLTFVVAFKEGRGNPYAAK